MSLDVISVVVPILCTIIFGLIAYANSQAMGRITDKLMNVDAKITTHLEDCHTPSIDVLDTRLKTTEEEVKRYRSFAHWVRNVLSIVMIKLNVDVKESE